MSSMITVEIVRKGRGPDVLVCGALALDDVSHALEDWSPVIDGPSVTVYLKSRKEPVTIKGTVYQLFNV